MKHVVIAVHGTWGRNPTGFYQDSKEPNSFCQRLLRSLAPDIPVEDIIWIPFEWDHTNNHQNRVEGARKLANLFDKHRKETHLIHVVAHSHGGNVALKAIEIYLGEIKFSIRRSLEGTGLNRSLVQDCFDHQSYDASQHLTDLTIDARKEITCFDFPWEDSLVEPRYRGSILGQHIGDGLSLDEKRQMLALEERGKEFLGVTGVRHSMYYENESVIEKIAAFIKDKSLPSFEPDSQSEVYSGDIL